MVGPVEIQQLLGSSKLINRRSMHIRAFSGWILSFPYKETHRNKYICVNSQAYGVVRVLVALIPLASGL